MNNLIINEREIQNKIYTIRGMQVMLDSDLAYYFECVNGTKDINKAVKRNKDRFPEYFCFQLTNDEYEFLRFQNGTSNDNTRGGRRYNPYVFTEGGVAMLSGVLHSEIAINVSIKIIQAFVLMRNYISNNLIEQKYINSQVMINKKQIESNTKDIKLIHEVLSKFDKKIPEGNVFYNGEVFDAYSCLLDIFNTAKDELVIIDPYADIELLKIIKELKTKAIIFTKENNLLSKDMIQKYNKQYNNLKVIYVKNIHDRFFILDRKTIYSCGTSINGIGKSMFSTHLICDNHSKDSILNFVNNLL